MTRKTESAILSLNPADEALPVVPEIDNLEDELIGEAVLKEFVPGKTYFDYQDILNKGVADALDKEGEIRAIYNAQVWLLCQIYEVELPDASRRPLGLEDIACLEGEELAFRIADVMSVSYKVNFLDGNEDLKTSNYFEITERALRFRVQKLSVEKGVKLQTISRDDPTGVKLTRWLITERMTINDERISEEDFKTKLDFAITVLLAAKVNFLLASFQRKKTSFAIRNTRAGLTAT
jgi:hypothetical protein